MTKGHNQARSRWVFLALAFSVTLNTLNLAGLADDLIVWRAFFQEGVIDQYAALKLMFLDLFPSWMQPPVWALDYLVLSGTTYIALHLRFLHEPEALEEENVSILQGVVSTIAWLVVAPVLITYFLLVALIAYLPRTQGLVERLPFMDSVDHARSRLQYTVVFVGLALLPVLGVILVFSRLQELV